jgi:Putative restriction endonuclease
MKRSIRLEVKCLVLNWRMNLSPEYIVLQTQNEPFRLEIIGRETVWEAIPPLSHQLEINRIHSTIKPRADQVIASAFITIKSALFKFSDGSLKHADLAILKQESDALELKQPIEYVPVAVIEVVNHGYEYKDRIAPQFYLERGVEDVIIFDPQTLEMTYHSRSVVVRYQSPARFDLECGCQIEV